MFKWLASVLRWIVGRIKKVNKNAFFVALGTALLPLSVYMLIESPKDIRWLAFAMFITSIIFLVSISVRIILEEKRERTTNIADKAKADMRYQELIDILRDIQSNTKK